MSRPATTRALVLGLLDASGSGQVGPCALMAASGMDRAVAAATLRRLEARGDLVRVGRATWTRSPVGGPVFRAPGSAARVEAALLIMGRPATTRDLCDRIHEPAHVVAAAMARVTEAGRAVRVGRGIWRAA
jgi:hypothetical protein